MRILVRGGSIAAGVGVSRGYADILRERCGPHGVEVVNRSKPKETSFEGIERFSEDIEPYRPDILIVHFGIDDAFSAVYRSEFKENLVQITRRAREKSPTPILLPTSHTFDDPFEMDAVNIYYRVIREVAADLACEMVPVHTAWAGYLLEAGLANSALVQGDVRLPNEKGHELYASVLIRYLARLI
ncbi:MAG TPA: SGNH/GDSL hydrolase family protein [Syntrophales bacterium]|nr:SGNH/GDSL hydrolase family protein [Syntrophales bacterium]